MSTPEDVDALVARLRAAGCVYAEDEAALLLEEPDAERREALVRRRVAGEPLEVVLGWAAFDGLRVPVTPGVFVPRARTGLVVRLAAAGLRTGDLAVDLCCGSGAVALALAARVPGLEVHAADLDPVAVACTRRSLPADRVHAGDLYAALPPALRGRVAVVALNAPYVPSAAVATMPREAREHEPAHTLDGGPDGLALHRRALAGAPAWLRRGGRVVTEVSPDQAEVLAAEARSAGHAVRTVVDDDLDACAVEITLPAR